VAELAKATTVIGSDGSAGSTLTSGAKALEVAAKSGDLAAAKGKYVALVSSLQSWTDSAGISGSLKGL
jgi:hypothetical protein